MCRSKAEGGRRCKGIFRWFVNCENHPRAAADPKRERRFFKPQALLSQTPGAMRTQRHRSKKEAKQVEAVKTLRGLGRDEVLSPVDQEYLWEQRRLDGGLTLLAMTDRVRAIAEDEAVPTAEIVERFERQEIRPSRQWAGKGLASLVVAPDNTAWIEPEHLVRMIQPSENGDPAEVYVTVVKDVQEVEWVLVRSYDGGDPMVWPHSAVGVKAAAQEALDRLRALHTDPTAYEAWVEGQELHEGGAAAPWTQSMSDADFLAHSGDGGMHLV